MTIQLKDLEATELHPGNWAVRPKGQLGTYGWHPEPWTIIHVKATNSALAIQKAFKLLAKFEAATTCELNPSKSKLLFSKRHYLFLAASLDASITAAEATGFFSFTDGAIRAARNLADSLAKDNPKFDKAKFLWACGLLAEAEAKAKTP